MTVAKPKRRSPRPHVRRPYRTYKGTARNLAEFESFIRQQQAAGLCDHQIRVMWNELHPNDLTSADRVGRVRRRLGLVRNKRDMGVMNRERFRLRDEYNKSHGWPTGLSPRCVQVLDALYEFGPMTKPEIAERSGLWLRRDGNLPLVKGGPITDQLQRLGLVQVLHKSGTYKGKRRLKVFALRVSVERNFDGN